MRHRSEARGRERRKESRDDKTPGAQSPFATKNLGFVTTAGIPSHKPAERAAACVSSSTTRRRLREKWREEGQRGKEKKKQREEAVEREREAV